MSVIPISDVRHPLRVLIEAKKSSQLIIRHIIAVELVRRHEGKHVAPVTLMELHVISHNAQHNLIIDKNISFLIKNLLHLPLII